MIKFLKSEFILIFAWTMAIITMFFVPLNKDYWGYINFSVLSMLFCLMAVVAGLMKTGVFQLLSQKLLSISNNIKIIALLLICACFFSAMLVTNDVALLTFVPLTLGIMGAVGQKQAIFVLVLETIAANIGSMLTPIGNPQNLYLYSFYNMNIGEFFSIVAPVCLLGFMIIVVFVLLTPSGTIDITIQGKASIQNKPHFLGYCLLFFLAILTIIHIVDYGIMLAITVIVLFFLDKNIFMKVDYSLLLTFVAFFIFVGNLGNIPWIQTEITSWIAEREFIMGILISQIISNVPAAIMLSGFTQKASSLLLGVNIGGLGTCVASLASLISLKLYVKSINAKPGIFFLVFTVCNFIILALLVMMILIFDL